MVQRRSVPTCVECPSCCPRAPNSQTPTGPRQHPPSRSARQNGSRFLVCLNYNLSCALYSHSKRPRVRRAQQQSASQEHRRLIVVTSPFIVGSRPATLAAAVCALRRRTRNGALRAAGGLMAAPSRWAAMVLLLTLLAAPWVTADNLGKKICAVGAHWLARRCVTFALAAHVIIPSMICPNAARNLRCGGGYLFRAVTRQGTLPAWAQPFTPPCRSTWTSAAGCRLGSRAAAAAQRPAEVPLPA